MPFLLQLHYDYNSCKAELKKWTFFKKCNFAVSVKM